jgi:molybdenum cofactor guanylyltransferase
MISEEQLGRLAVVILAGGQGSRLGGIIKSNLIVGGRTLLERVVESLPPQATVLLSIGPHDPGRFALPRPMECVPDLPGDAGPLAGLRAAADALARQSDFAFLASVAVDTPFLPNEFIERLLEPVVRGSGACVARSGDELYPTNALYQLDKLAEVLPRFVDNAKPFGPKAVLTALHAEEVVWPIGRSGDPFSSINSPADLAAAEARAARERAL